MAAKAPREGLEFTPGTMDEVGVELLKHVDDPQDVVAYAGYGFWAPAKAIRAVKGAEKQELTNAPIAPLTAPYVDDDEYKAREVDDYGQPVKPDHFDDSIDEKANAGTADVGVDEEAKEADFEEPSYPEKVSKPFGDVGVDEKPVDQPEESEDVPEKVSAQYGDTDGANPATEPEHDAAVQNDDESNETAPKRSRSKS